MTLVKKIIVLLPIMLLACGTPNSAPSGSTITVGPGKTLALTKALTVASTCPASPYYPQSDQQVVITVKDSAGTPLAGVDIDVALDSNPIELYDGFIAATNVTATPVTSPIRMKTGADGTKDVTVRFYAGCNAPYSSNLNVYSGSAYGSATYAVTFN